MRISDWSSDVCSSDLDLAVGVYVGFDEPRTLGPHDTGSNVAAPVFKAFMADALTPEDAVPFRIPPGIRMVRLNAETGQLAPPGATKVFRSEERRVGRACVRTCRSRWSPHHSQNTNIIQLILLAESQHIPQ